MGIAIFSSLAESGQITLSKERNLGILWKAEASVGGRGEPTDRDYGTRVLGPRLPVLPPQAHLEGNRLRPGLLTFTWAHDEVQGNMSS